jgi:hypothetical protein
MGAEQRAVPRLQLPHRIHHAWGTFFHEWGRFVLPRARTARATAPPRGAELGAANGPEIL